MNPWYRSRLNAARDKRRYAYFLTPKGMAEKAALMHRFLRRKLAEFAALKTEIEALRREESEAAGTELNAKP